MPTFPVADPDLFTRWRPQNISYIPPTTCFAVYLHNVGNDVKVVDVLFAVDVAVGGVVDVDFDFDSGVDVALLKINATTGPATAALMLQLLDTAGSFNHYITFVFFYAAYTREIRHPRFSQEAVNRWLLVVTLLRNPSLIQHRRQWYSSPIEISEADTDSIAVLV